MDRAFDQAVRPLTHREFRRFQQLIHSASGIFLSEAKKALIVGRLTRRLRTLGLRDFSTYLDRVEQENDAERTQMMDCICTNETRFFREPRQFEFLDEQILPRWRTLAASGERPRRIRAWSAACSTGEEPFSVAMLLRAHLATEEGWSAGVLASDLSTKVLAIAREATWPIERAADIPDAYKRAFMLKGVRSAEGRIRARAELQSMIEFRQLNLNEPTYPVEGTFDLIFCRNVLIYFNQETKAAVIDRLSRHLSPGGLLFLGHAETIIAAAHGLKHAGPAAYTRIPS